MSVSGTEYLSALDAILYNRPAGRNIIDFAREEIEKLRDKVRGLVAALDDQHGTPCEQIRHQQEVERLRELLREWLELGHHDMDFKKRVREALGDE